MSIAMRARRGREAAAGERCVIRGAGGSGWVSRPREQAGVSQLTEEEAAAFCLQTRGFKRPLLPRVGRLFGAGQIYSGTECQTSR